MEKKTILLLYSLLLLAMVSAHTNPLRHGFYSSTCPQLESIVRTAVSSHFKSNDAVPAKLLRIHFHDCFVRGCDASNLVDGDSSEKSVPPNRAMTGYDVVDDIKARVESQCPNVVSCADILALAARDSVVLANGTSWKVLTGRRDGLVSSASDVSDLPAFRDSADVQLKKFAKKGLTAHDLVVLAGAHSIGTAACKSMSYRLYNYTGQGTGTDSSLDQTFLPQLQAMCPKNGNGSKRIELDIGSSTQFDTSFYENLRRGRGILESDQNLWTDNSTRTIGQRFIGCKGRKFNAEFARAMIKMSMIGVKTGTDGEIRKVCSAFN